MKVRHIVPALGLALACMSAFMPVAQAADTPAFIAKAISDSRRPETDTKRDADRKPAEMVAFAEIKPGSKVVDLVPGAGYFARIFAEAVGTTGKVYAFYPSELDPIMIKRSGSADASPFFAAYPTVTVLHMPINTLATPEPVDVVWTAQNYHDMHLGFMAPADLALINKAVFNALKPGGLYIVIDHSATAGSGLADSEKLHRIDEALVRKEVEQAGFVFVSASDALKNASDPRTANVFAPELRGHTDQFILKFKKPAK
jgi:predicted methyltransferase